MGYGAVSILPLTYRKRLSTYSSEVKYGPPVPFPTEFHVTIRDSQFINNTGIAGGAIALMELSDSEVTISNCTFIGNTVKHPYGKFGDGGAIGALALKRTSVSIDKCRFINNTAESNNGGAVALLHTSDTSFIISSSTFQGNTAGSRGGCIAAKQASPLSVRDSSFTGCTARGFGGGIALENVGTVTSSEYAKRVYGDHSAGLQVEGSFFSNCTAQSGGAIAAMDSFLLARGNTFQFNSVLEYGNAIYAFRRSGLYDLNNFYSKNSATSGSGGAVLVQEIVAAIFDSSIYRRNEQNQGGAIAVLMSDFVTIANITCVGNHAYSTGGCIDFRQDKDGRLTITGSTLSNNTARSVGGSIYAVGETKTTIIGSLISYSEAVRGGGIALSRDSHVIMRDDSVLRTNRAQYGGAVFLGDFSSSFRILASSDQNFNTVSLNQAKFGAVFAGRGLVRTTGAVSFQMNIALVTDSRSEKLGYGSLYYYTDKAVNERYVSQCEFLMLGSGAKLEGNKVYTAGKLVFFTYWPLRNSPQCGDKEVIAFNKNLEVVEATSGASTLGPYGKMIGTDVQRLQASLVDSNVALYPGEEFEIYVSCADHFGESIKDGQILNVEVKVASESEGQVVVLSRAINPLVNGEGIVGVTLALLGKVSDDTGTYMLDVELTYSIIKWPVTLVMAHRCDPSSGKELASLANFNAQSFQTKLETY
jgi:hypothetical protein